MLLLGVVSPASEVTSVNVCVPSAVAAFVAQVKETVPVTPAASVIDLVWVAPPGASLNLTEIDFDALLLFLMRVLTVALVPRCTDRGALTETTCASVVAPTTTFVVAVCLSLPEVRSPGSAVETLKLCSPRAVTAVVR